MNRGRASSTSADRTGGHKKDNARSVSAPPAPPSFRVSRGRGTGKLRTRLDLHGLKIIEYSLVGSEAAGGIWEILQAKDARLGNTRSIIELYARIDFAKNPSPMILAKRMLARGQVVPFTFGYTQKPRAPGVLDPRVAIEVSAEIFYNGRATYAICVEHQEVALQCDQDFTLVNKVMSATREGKKGEAATWLLRREAPIPVHISYFGSRLENLDLDMTTVNRQYRNYLSQPSISFTPPPGGMRNVNAGFELRLQAPRMLQSAAYSRAFGPKRIWNTFASH